MANKILIIGQSGTGKSTSLRNLDPKETYVIQLVKKELPFRGWRTNYNDDNLKYLNRAESIMSYLKNISDKAPQIKQIIIDDFQYLMSDEFMRRAKEKGFEKFTDIGLNAYNVLRAPDELRDDLSVVFLTHIETVDGLEKMKTIGKMLDDKITVEGLFSIVLKSVCSDGAYYFETQNSGSNTIKSPMEMFEKEEPNDLKEILNKIEEYNK